MKILVVGGGGREHAVIKSLKKNASVTKIYALPGNGGIADDAECYPVKATDVDGIVKFASEHPVDFAVVTPDDPLVLGCVNRLEAIGIPCFGPRAEAAIIEGSKVFSKNLMKKYGIPTAASESFSDAEAAIAYLKTQRYPVVIKADGLALGKGVIIAQNAAEAERAVREIMCDKIFGASGNKILVEEFLEGPEVSVLAFTDGKTIVPMVSSMDHKRAKDGDEGLNTGGMGTVAPNPYYTEKIARECMDTIFRPTVSAMNAEGRTFKGCLYFGLMLTRDGAKVIEYNCRFGDPETQVVLPLLESDLLTIMQAVRNGTLTQDMVRFKAGAACCVVLASDGYPQKYETGYEISTPETGKDEFIFVAGAKKEDGRLKTSGGRVLGATATGDTLKEAVRKAYALAERVGFENAYYRKDIGGRALACLREE
ncbi:MAG: phosphoribosylamine--glycine ligase [Candidatus Gallimonas sp.]